MSATCAISGASSSIAPSLRVNPKPSASAFAMPLENDIVSLTPAIGLPEPAAGAAASCSALSNNAVIFGIISLIIALLVLVAFVFIESCFFAPNSFCASPPLKKFANPLGPCALPEISPAACNALVSSPFGGAIFGFC